MSAQPDVDRSLRLIRALTDRMAAELARLAPDDWNRPTTCPPWQVRTLIGHVVSSGESFRLSVERGVAGSTEPPLPETERERRIARAAAAPPDELQHALACETPAIEALYERLSADELAAICYHRRGNRPASWYIQHRLAEVAFHLWDLERSLGRPAVLEPEVGAFLLPMLLESNLPRIYASGPRGQGWFRLVAEGLPNGTWLLAASPDRLEVTRGADAADSSAGLGPAVTISAAPAVLALLVYGRADLDQEERQGRLRVDGDRALAARFSTIFRGP